MRYKAMAVKLRQATGTEDPTPTEKLLDEPRCEVVARLLEDFRRTFSFLEAEVGRLVDPGAVLAEGKDDIGSVKGRGEASLRPGQGRAARLRTRLRQKAGREGPG